MGEPRHRRLAIGRIRTSHGVRGYLKIESYSGELDHFSRLSSVNLSDGRQERVFAVEDIRASTGHLLLKLEGVDTPEAARALSGWEILVDRECAAPLGENEYYIGDLCGCDVVCRGRGLGTVVSVCEGGGGDLLEVEVPSGRRFLVPFRKEFVGTVDTHRGVVELEADWLLQ